MTPRQRLLALLDKLDALDASERSDRHDAILEFMWQEALPVLHEITMSDVMPPGECREEALQSIQDVRDALKTIAH
jgi:hypothetical protein